MVFNSLTFLIFLLVVFSLYWLLNRRWQNILLLVASYVFYGWWDWRFLSLILYSSLIDFWVGWRIGQSTDPTRRKLYLLFSLITNLGLLGFFKYHNFFAESFATVLNSFGVNAGPATLNIVLPVGISFYTFQALSYTIDVYRRRCPAHSDLIEFLAFISFFPQLVAGPIERATNLLGQFTVERQFDLEKAKDGLRQMLWGFFQKIVVADGLAGYVNQAYSRTGAANGGELLLATYFFAFQIYCDFAGYSNIAIGCARLFGFRLTRNFAYPLFARTIPEFWQRWHISLMTWFRDYVYVPLAGNRKNPVYLALVIVLTFTLSGLWHGANWTFVLWGLLNGIYFVFSMVYRRFKGRAFPRQAPVPGLRNFWGMVLTFHLIFTTLFLFRAQDLAQVMDVASAIGRNFSLAFFLRDALTQKALIVVLLVVEWLQRAKAHPLEISRFPLPVRWVVYNGLAASILLLGNFTYNPFIYFQF